MKRTLRQTGFTLVELLVVIGIVGVLSATFLGVSGSVRRSSRDARRITDMEQVEQALRLYYLKCGMYPGSYTDQGECIGGESANTSGNPSTWAELESILVSAKVGVGDIPYNPVGEEYAYFVQLRKAGDTPRAQCYILHAELEENNPVLQNDLDNDDIVNQLLPKNTGITEKQLYPSNTINCNDDAQTGTFNYCKGNIECFHGN